MGRRSRTPASSSTRVHHHHFRFRRSCRPQRRRPFILTTRPPPLQRSSSIIRTTRHRSPRQPHPAVHSPPPHSRSTRHSTSSCSPHSPLLLHRGQPGSFQVCDTSSSSSLLRTRDTLFLLYMPGCGPFIAYAYTYTRHFLDFFPWDSNPHRSRFFLPPPTLFDCMDSGCCACIR